MSWRLRPDSTSSPLDLAVIVALAETKPEPKFKPEPEPGVQEESGEATAEEGQCEQAEVVVQPHAPAGHTPFSRDLLMEVRG